jgi:hypothetical protein
MTIPSRRLRPRKHPHPPGAAAHAIIALGILMGGCASPPQRKPIEMTAIGTVPVVEPDGGTTTSPNSGTGASAKEAACTMAEIDSLEQVLRGCDSPMPKAGDVPGGLADKLELSVTSSTPSTTPGGRVDVTLTLKNKTNDSLPLYFSGDPKPRFEVEAFDGKGVHRVDLPLGKAPKTAYPPTRPVKASRITLMAGGSARIRVRWDAVKTRWAPEKVKTWEGRGPARTVLADLPYGKYMLRVAIPLILAEKGEMDLPKVGIDVVK